MAKQTDAMTLDDLQTLKLGILEHLVELRNRAFKSICVLALGLVIGSLLAGQGIRLLQQPYCALISEQLACRFQLISPTDGILVYLQVALLIAGIIGVPFICYQILCFLLPALKPDESRIVFLSILPFIALFLSGIAFAWFVLLPPSIGFLQGFQAELFRPEWTADLYLSYVVTLIFWMGVAFELPLLVFILSLVGLANSQLLRQHWRLAIVGSALAAAFITPTVDPVNMALVVFPLLTLYTLSIFLAKIAERLHRNPD